MSRPFFKYSARQLEELFDTDGQNPATLKLLKEELSHRTKNKAIELLARVEVALKVMGGKEVKKQSEPIVMPVEPAQLQFVQIPDQNQDGVYEEDESENKVSKSSELRIGNGTDASVSFDDLKKPNILTSMRPRGTRGLPEAYIRQLSQDVNLKVYHNADVVDLYIAAVGALILEMKRTSAGQKRYELENGIRVIEASLNETRYIFPFADDAGLFDDAKIIIEISGHRYEGSIVSISAGRLEITISDDLGPELKTAVLVIDATALLEALKTTLGQVKSGETAINRALSAAAVNRGPDPAPPDLIPVSADNKNLNKSQKEVRNAFIKSSVTRIWGPPGCGKTHVLGEIVRSAFDAGKRVLVCSNTNKAVDQVLLSICKRLGREHPVLEEGLMLRV